MKTTWFLLYFFTVQNIAIPNWLGIGTTDHPTETTVRQTTKFFESKEECLKGINDIKFSSKEIKPENMVGFICIEGFIINYEK